MKNLICNKKAFYALIFLLVILFKTNFSYAFTAISPKVEVTPIVFHEYDGTMIWSKVAFDIYIRDKYNLSVRYDSKFNTLKKKYIDALTAYEDPTYVIQRN